jgi:DNA-binding HxlR family transcriptional regulator
MARRTNRNKPTLIRFSAALTGRERLLSVVLAIDSNGLFNATALQPKIPEIGVDKISKELRQLEEMGLVEEVESDSAAVDFRIANKKAWQALRVLADCANEGRIEVP